jgi:hypothetical protein
MPNESPCYAMLALYGSHVAFLAAVPADQALAFERAFVPRTDVALVAV